MRIRILLLALLLVIAVDADFLLWPGAPSHPAAEPIIVLHDRPEMAYEDEPGSFAETIRTALAAKRYDELEALADTLRDPDRRFSGGISQITRFYDIAAEYRTIPNEMGCNEDRDPASFDDKRAQLEAWHEAMPDRSTAAVALLKLWVKAGIGSRGCGYSKDVSDEQRQKMRADFAKTRTYLAQLDLDQDPVAYVETIDMGMFAGWGSRALNALYEKAIKTYPTYYPLYAQHAMMLTESWSARPGQLRFYLDWLRAPERGAEGQVAYAFAAFRLIHNYYQPDSTDSDGLPFPAIVAAYQVRERRYGLRPRDWKALFYFSLRAGMCEIGHQAVQRMGTDWDSTIWERREDFDKDIAWYREHTPYRGDLALLGG